MRAMPIFRASVLTLALTTTLGTGTLAARPDSGSRNIQDFATANFQQAVDACTDLDLTVVFTAGANLQVPIGSGRPGSWSDVGVSLQLFNTCLGEVAYLLTGETTGVDPNITRLGSATVDGVVVHLVDSTGTVSIDVVVDLTWSGNDDATVRIDHQLDAGYFRQERYETAQVSGSVEDVIQPGIAFTAGDVTGATIGTANEIALP